MAGTAAGPATRHPKTGERRKFRRPLQLDCLPLAMLDRIRAERAAGRNPEADTGDEILPEPSPIPWPKRKRTRRRRSKTSHVAPTDVSRDVPPYPATSRLRR